MNSPSGEFELIKFTNIYILKNSLLTVLVLINPGSEVTEKLGTVDLVVISGSGPGRHIQTNGSLNNNNSGLFGTVIIINVFNGVLCAARLSPCYVRSGPVEGSAQQCSSCKDAN